MAALSYGKFTDQFRTIQLLWIETIAAWLNTFFVTYDSTPPPHELVIRCFKLWKLLIAQFESRIVQSFN